MPLTDVELTVILRRERDELRAEVKQLRAEVELMRDWARRKSAVRGVDFPCEGCGALGGSTLCDGWYRCNACGYPSK